MPTYYQGLGTEDVVDDVYVVFRQRFNDALAVQQTIGDERDATRAEILGEAPVLIELESVPDANFHAGSIPSFVQTSDKASDYPMVVVKPNRTNPDPEDARQDNFNVYVSALEIHSFARARPNEGATVAYRRAMRMAEAAHQVVRTDAAIKRKLSGVSGPVLVDRSEPWMFPAEDGHGEDWCWMAVMHLYQVRNYSMDPEVFA